LKAIIPSIVELSFLYMLYFYMKKYIEYPTFVKYIINTFISSFCKIEHKLVIILH